MSRLVIIPLRLNNMSQITNGVRAVLSNPIIYNFTQNILGAKRSRLDLVSNFIKPQKNNRILDIGCGTAEILDFLPIDTDYVGYDIDDVYISAAKKRYTKRGKFHCGYFDAKSVENESSFDIVLMLGILHHLDDEVAELLLRNIASVLSPAGRLITIDPCYSQGQNPLARFLISKDRGQNIRSPNEYNILMHSVFKNTRGTLRHRSMVPYTHWIMECSK